MVYSDELLAVAKRIFWFGTPEEALEFPLRSLTYAMTCASDEDIEILSTSVTTTSKPRWMTPHPAFSTKDRGRNGINAAAIPPFHHFRSDAFQT